MREEVSYIKMLSHEKSGGIGRDYNEIDNYSYQSILT